MFADYDPREYDDADLRAEAMAERRRRAQWNHFCMDCLGFTGPGSPCAPEEEEEPEAEQEENEE